MDQCGDREEGVPPREHESQSEAQRRRPGPEPGSEPSCVSFKSDQSKDPPIAFKLIVPSDQQSTEGLGDQSTQKNPAGLDSIFKDLKDNINTFMSKELQKIQRVLSPDYQEDLESQRDDGELLEGVDKEQQRRNREAFVTIAVDFLKRMKQEELADRLLSKSPVTCKNKLKTKMKNKFQHLFEGIAKAGKPTPLNQIYTELYITEGGTGAVSDEHEVRQIETASRKAARPETTIRQEDIFKLPPGRHEPIRTVMTMGVAGIGKTVLTQKFTLDWAEDKANQNIHFLFPFTFRELNLLKEKKFSLVELVHHFFTETKEIWSFEEFQVVFIFDGLDECRLPLDFTKNLVLSDVRESTSVDVLLTSLIKGNLLPSAHLWITTRPAAANQIPPECVGMVTEVRGFTDPQKEEYFRKKFRDEKQSKKVISHIKSSQSLHIMCRIPVFCWITATVLEDMMETREGEELPNTLTEMYIHFLVVQTKVKKIKYDGGAATDPHWSPESRKMIESLGKLAFDQLEKGKLIFYESDLVKYDIDISAASVRSGVFTQIFKEERGLYQDKVFFFVHLSVQEFLAALHAHLTFSDSQVNLLEEQQTTFHESKTRTSKDAEIHFYQRAIEKALQSSNGHLDLFLRFFLGLSLGTNQTLLQGLLTQKESWQQTNQETVQYLKDKIGGNLTADKLINLFHCLGEVNDCSLVEEIQQSLSSGSLSTDQMSPAQWSALVFILLSSVKDLDVFDLKKYSNSEKALLKLLPVVQTSNKVLLSVCNLSEQSCELLSSVLKSSSASLRDLDLSNNDLQDEGVKLLSDGLKSTKCVLKTLRLSGCLITEEGCAFLVSALKLNPTLLEELDLSYNHPGEESVEALTAGQRNPDWSLNKLWLEPAGDRWLTHGLKKYSCQLTINEETINGKLKLSDNNRKVTCVDEDQKYPDHPNRFDFWPQVMCTDSLPDRCYWEVIWNGKVEISVTYEGVQRKVKSNDCEFGFNSKSWTLSCSDEGRYSVCHDSKREYISSSSSSSPAHKLGVYVDRSSGTLSFYRTSSSTPVHLHTLTAKFTEPLYPGFGFWPGSSVFLCSAEP
nr:protein NLRC3 [Nothobranchius furzeri]